MPFFSTQPSTSLTSSVRNLVASGAGNGMQELALAKEVAGIQHQTSLAEKARIESDALRSSEAARADPALATDFASNAAGLDQPTGTRLSNYLRGVLEQPSAADISDAAIVGNEAQPFRPAPPNVTDGQRSQFQASIAATIANRLATGKTNAEQLVHAAERGQEGAVLARAADAALRGDVTGVNLNAAGVLGKKELTPFKTGTGGITTNEYVGSRDESGPTALVSRKAIDALAAQRAAEAGNFSAQAGLHRAQTDLARGEGGAGKPPPGYAWGPKNEQGQPTLIAIQGGPANPGGAAGGAGNLSGEEVLKSLPAARSSIVKGMIEGRVQPPSSFALKSPYWQENLEFAARVDPGFDFTTWTKRVRTANDAAVGTLGKSNNALNTGIGHLMQLSDAVDGLGNVGSMPFARTINKVKNAVSKESGGTGVTDFESIVNRVAPEITKIWRGAGGAEADIKRDIDSLSNANTPEQLHSAIRNIAGLMESKLEANANQFKQGMGTSKDVQFIIPEARQQLDTLAKRAGKPSEGSGGAQPQVQATKTIDGVTYVKVGGQWHQQ